MPTIRPKEISSTADVVAVPCQVIHRLNQEGHVTGDARQLAQDAVATIDANIDACGSGTVVVLLQVQRLTEECEALDRYRVRFLSTPYGLEVGGSDVGSVSSAAQQEWSQRPIAAGCLESATNTSFGAFIVTNLSSTSGQLSHPSRLKTAFERVADIVPETMQLEDGVRFLEVLESACLQAKRTCSRRAGVAIRDTVSHGSQRLEFEPVVANDPDTVRLETVKLERSRCSVAGLDVVVHEPQEMPR